MSFPGYVIPAKAGIQVVDPRFRGDDRYGTEMTCENADENP